MSVFSKSPPLVRQGFGTSAPQSSDALKAGSAGRTSLLAQQFRSKPNTCYSPVTPLGLGWSYDTEDATPFTYAVSCNTPKLKKAVRSFDSIANSVGTGVDTRTRAVRTARSKGEPVPVSVGFRVNRKTVDNYVPPAVQSAYKNDVKPVGLLNKQLSMRRGLNEEEQTTAACKSPTSPTSPGLKKPPTLRPLVTQAGGSTDDLPALERLNSLGSTPRSALEANLKLADGHDSLLKEAQARYPIFHDKLVRRAFTIARSSHTGNYRQNGDPCLAKCVGTAQILADYGLGATVVAAGLLNDCLDDSMMTEDQLRHLIDDEVVDMVVGVGKLRSLHDLYSTSIDQLSEVDLDRLRTMLLVMSDVNVMMIKLADQLRVLGSLDALPAEHARAVLVETRSVLVPLAGRLGVWRLKSDLEDACMRHDNPEEYKTLAAALAAKCDPEAVLARIAEAQGALAAAGVEYRDIAGRNKNVAGVHKKMRKKGKKLEEVYDVRAIRIVVNHERECYKVLEAIHGLWAPRATKDYIRSPKPNGYQSLHTVVTAPDGGPLEVQIRTERMDQVAEYGVAAHWRYKEDSASGANPFHERQVEWARFVLSWHAEVNDHKLRVDPGHTVEGACGEGEAEVRACTFPEHRPDCKHRRLETEPAPSMSSSRQDTDPVYVIVRDGGSIDLRMLPPRATLRTLRAKLAQVQCMEDVRLVVNAEEEMSGGEEEAPLAMGDVIDLVVESKPGSSPGSSPALIDISEDAIHRERQRLSQLWSSTNGGAAAEDEQPVYYYEAPKARPVRILRPAMSAPELS